MRLAIVADIHGNLPALEAVLADLPRHAPDLIVNLGDLVTAPLWPRETLEQLQTLAWPTVRGNHDRWVTGRPSELRSAVMKYTHDALTSAQRAWLSALPATLAVTDDVLAVHGTPESDTTYLLEDLIEDRLCLSTAAAVASRLEGVRERLVLCGHSHLQHVATSAAGHLVVNPGSVGCPRAAGNVDPHRNEAASPHARYAVATRRGRTWSVDLLAVTYDWARVNGRAIETGHPAWAEGFGVVE